MSELEIGDRIGGGAFGSVHRGRFHGTDVAVKIVEGGPAELKNFQMEAKMLATLRHPNVTLFMAAFLDPSAKKWALVTEFVERGSLWDVLRETDLDWTEKRQVQVALGVARGLAYLHAHNVLHRDLKSPNILVDDDYRIKLCDVGLARHCGHQNMTVGCGTTQWMAPEIANSQPYGPPADVFSFAIVLFEIASRQCPYDEYFADHEEVNAVALALRVVHHGLRPTLPPLCSFAALATLCWAPDPTSRPPIKAAIPVLETLLAAAI